MVITTIVILALVNILFGLLVLIFPGFLRWVIGLYFLITGILMLLLK